MLLTTEPFSLSSPSFPLYIFSIMIIYILAFQANTKFNSRWTTDEQLLAVQGGSCHGKN